MFSHAALFGSKRATPAPAWWFAFGDISPDNVVGAYTALGVETLNDSYINLANESLPLTTSAAPTLGSDGWVFNGTSQLLSTGLVPTAGWSMMVMFKDTSTSGDALRVAAGAAAQPRFYVSPSYQLTTDPGYVYGYGSAATILRGAKVASGTLGINSVNGYLNGVRGNALSTTFTGTSGAILIGSATGTGSYWFLGSVAAVVICNIPLTEAQMIALHSAMVGLYSNDPENWYSWNASSGADGYEVRVRPVGSSVWTYHIFSASVLGVALQALGITSGTWELQVAAFVWDTTTSTGRDTSAFSDSSTVTL